MSNLFADRTLNRFRLPAELLDQDQRANVLLKRGSEGREPQPEEVDLRLKNFTWHSARTTLLNEAVKVHALGKEKRAGGIPAGSRTVAPGK